MHRARAPTDDFGFLQPGPFPDVVRVLGLGRRLPERSTCVEALLCDLLPGTPSDASFDDIVARVADHDALPLLAYCSIVDLCDLWVDLKDDYGVEPEVDKRFDEYRWTYTAELHEAVRQLEDPEHCTNRQEVFGEGMRMALETIKKGDMIDIQKLARAFKVDKSPWSVGLVEASDLIRLTVCEFDDDEIDEDQLESVIELTHTPAVDMLKTFSGLHPSIAKKVMLAMDTLSERAIFTTICVCHPDVATSVFVDGLAAIEVASDDDLASMSDDDLDNRFDRLGKHGSNLEMFLHESPIEVAADVLARIGQRNHTMRERGFEKMFNFIEYHSFGHGTGTPPTRFFPPMQRLVLHTAVVLEEARCKRLLGLAFLALLEASGVMRPENYTRKRGRVAFEKFNEQLPELIVVEAFGELGVLSNTKGKRPCSTKCHKAAPQTFDCGTCGGCVIECVDCGELICTACDDDTGCHA